MKVLVTGGSGFLGHNIILKLCAAGHQVSCLDRVEAPFLRELGVRFFAGEMADAGVIDRALGEVEAVIHLACSILPRSADADSYPDMVADVGNTMKLLDGCVRRKVRRFIFFSSGGTVYGKLQRVPAGEDCPTDPICSYGVAKLMIEKCLHLYHHRFGLATCALRLANPYGPFQRVHARQGVIPVFCYQALRGEEIRIWGDGEVRRDFIYVDDAVEAVLRVLSGDAGGEINIGSGVATSLNELVATIQELVGRKLKVCHMAGRDCDVPVSVLDITRARTLLDWRPQVDLRRGVEMTLDWIAGHC